MFKIKSQIKLTNNL